MSNPLFDLSGKVAVVTGGTGVLGAAMCRGLSDAGATVVVLARDETKINALTESIKAAGRASMGVSADVLDKAALERAVQQISDAYGRIDILINGAGGNKP